MRRLYVTTSAILMRLTLPLLVVVLVQADWLLTVFGEEYREAAWISRVLVLGVLFDTAVGAPGPSSTWPACSSTTCSTTLAA